MNIEVFLQQHEILYQRFEHPPVFTCEEAERLCPDMPGISCKNLFLRDRKGTRHFLVVVPYEKSVDLKTLKDLLDIDKLSFASDDRLLQYLGVTPGSVTLLGVVHDTTHAVEVILDTAIAAADFLQCHPLVNTATVVLSQADVIKFFAATGHTPKIAEVPARLAAA